MQITGRGNYTEWFQRLGIELVNNPQQAAEPSVAAKILVQGMRDGTFTGDKLSDYIDGDRRDFVNARPPVSSNGTENSALGCKFL